MNRHKDEIKRKAKVCLQDQKCQQWVTYDNFADMYVQLCLCADGVCKHCVEQKTYSSDRNKIMENDVNVNVFSLPTKYKLIKPQY